jgi:cysteine desulfurase/selenocysteine lyase
VLAALAATEHYLAGLLDHALTGLASIPGVRMLGAARRRTSTISFVVDGHHPTEVATRLAGKGIAVWAGDNYAYELMRRFGLGESGGAIRASIVLYNDRGDLDRLLEAVAEIARG